MPAGTAERRCAAIVAELDIPEPFDLGYFLARLVLQRNKMIHLHPFTSGPGVPCGLWIGTAEADHIFHEEGTTPWHKTHIVLHEIGHMLLGHPGGAGVWQDLARLLVPDVDPALVRLVLGRSAYTSVEEREAETLASLILGQASAAPSPAPAVGPGTAALLCRLERAWGSGHRAARRRSWVPRPHRDRVPESGQVTAGWLGRPMTCPAAGGTRPGGKAAHDR